MLGVTGDLDAGRRQSERSVSGQGPWGYPQNAVLTKNGDNGSGLKGDRYRCGSEAGDQPIAPVVEKCESLLKTGAIGHDQFDP